MGTLGILGGGQLARMTGQAASILGVDVVIADMAADSPAARVSAREVLFPGGWDDPVGQAELARLASVVTLESEFVDADALEHLEARGARVLPSPGCVRVVQDKLRQKEALARAEIAVPPFSAVSAPEELEAIAAELGWPLMLKARRNGYDGRGNALVAEGADATAAFTRLGWPERALYVEAFASSLLELAVIVVRGQDGSVATYPVVETRQDPKLHICREVLAPAALPAAVAASATVTAVQAVETVGGVGVFGVELFLSCTGEVQVNELAPRPHNSGHYSIEGCATSQFSNHVRAVLGLPLGPTNLLAPAAAMVNLLGAGKSTEPTAAELAAALAQPNTYVHLYGKRESRAGRKMGHVTALADTLDVALASARAAADCLPL